VLLLGYAETVKAIFPPFPVPGYTPDFTGYDLDQRDIDWHNTYLLASPNDSLALVRTVSIVVY